MAKIGYPLHRQSALCHYLCILISIEAAAVAERKAIEKGFYEGLITLVKCYIVKEKNLP